MGRPVTSAATEFLPPSAYRSPEWHELRRQMVTASEIATVLNISPWSSPFDLWWSKVREEPPSPPTPDQRRGLRLEPLILEDFTDGHPELSLARAGLCINNDRPWQGCTPDALAYESDAPLNYDTALMEPVAVVEVKSAPFREGWGEENSDDIPVHYRAQVLWQMDVLGLSVAF